MRLQEILCILAGGRTLATSIFRLSCQKSSNSCEARHDLGLPALEFSDECQVTKDNLCVSCLPHPSRLVFVEIQWTANFDQQVRRVGHSPLCFWITLEKPLVFLFGGQSDPVFIVKIPKVPMSRKARFL